MSRWLWALLAGVVLVAIATVFWIDRRSVPPPVSRGATPVAPAPSPASTALSAATAQKAAPSAPSSPSPQPAPAVEAAAPPAPAATPNSARQAASPPAPSPEKPAAPPVVAERAFALACSRCACRSAAAATRARSGDAGSRGHIRAQELSAAGRDLGLFRRGLRAALPAPRRRLGLSGAGGQVRPGGDCRVAEEDPSPFRHLPD